MQLVLEISDEQAKEIAEKIDINKINSKKIQEVVLECIKGYFSKDNYAAVDKLMFNNDGYYNSRKEASWFCKQLFENCDYSKLQEIIDKAIADLMINERDILIKVLAEMFVSSLENRFCFSDSLKMVLTNSLNERGIKSE